MIVFVVNRIDELKLHQTTTRLIAEACRVSTRVAVTDVLSLAVRSPTDIRGLAVVIAGGSPQTPADICRLVTSPLREEIPLHEANLVMLRTSPGRDLGLAWAHRLCLQVARLVRDAGVSVVNDPVGLERASSKLYGACLPSDISPATLVAHSWVQARDYIVSLGKPVVIKPLLGSQGRDVFFVHDADEQNLSQLCELLGQTGYLVIQEFMPDAIRGDIRVLLLDGKVLEVGGVLAAVHRVPRVGEFRSNIALGAKATPVELTEVQRRVARRTAEIVLEDGIRFSGLDLVGDRVVEVNVYSTGGLVDAELFYGVDYATVVLAALSDHAQRREPTG